MMRSFPAPAPQSRAVSPMKILILSLTLALVPGTHPGALAKPAQPNIVLVYTDDQGYGDASCLNPRAQFKTPHQDRLAREGMTFTDAHCSDTVCTPSR
ncbi:MAG: sulfatase-like hydrolase/transferase, partial [Verrucomicrobiota bacterium]|nr:sulfatase-like hydrolase/transferase [Verrucomicrobiota bacterium]